MCTTIIQQKMRLLKISWISLLATGIGILGFGIIVTVYPRIAGHTEEGLLRAIGVATTGMGIFGVMITLGAYRRKEKRGMVYSLVLSYFLDNTFGGRIAARK
jgi:ABC-type transport system involved in multi-copper enzyme maturation permease subunit